MSLSNPLRFIQVNGSSPSSFTAIRIFWHSSLDSATNVFHMAAGLVFLHGFYGRANPPAMGDKTVLLSEN